MSGYSFRPPIDEPMGLFIGLTGGPGTGKTWSGMELCSGIVGPENPFAVIDTENRRASHYKKYFKFEVFNFESPFSSGRYGEVVQAAYDSGYKAIMIDSFSHEHDGIGGYLDSQKIDLTGRVERYMKKYPESREYDVIDKFTPSSWIKPQAERKRMRQIILACSSTVPIVFCLRAEEKIFHNVDGKLVASKTPEWKPICDKGIPFEMTVFFMFHSDKPGYPHVYLKPMQEQHKPLFPLDKPLGRESGRLIAEWSSGGALVKKGADEPSPMPPAPPPAPDPKKERDFVNIMARERKRLGDERFLGVLGEHGFERLEEIADREKQIKIYRVITGIK